MLVTQFESSTLEQENICCMGSRNVCACNFAVEVMNKGEPEDVFELALYCVIAGIQVYRWEGVPQERKPTEIEVFVSGSFYNRLNEFPVAA